MYIVKIAKMFVVWCLTPFIVYVVFISVASRIEHSGAPFHLFFSVKTQAMLWVPALLPAFVGTAILSQLPIRKRLTGVIIGAVLALCLIVAVAYLELTFLGGFEENPGILLRALIVLIPSCLAGAYAGALRTTKP